jgi:hypothetical protein
VASPVKVNFKVYQGSTFREVFRWESSTKSYAAITNITKSAPVVVTAPAHGIPVGWRAKITGVVGMREINSDEYKLVTATTADTVVINEINAAGYTAYTSGGILEHNVPVSLSGYTGRMQIRPSLESTTVISDLTSANGGVLIDTTLQTITIEIAASQTQLFTFQTAVYSLELVKGAEVVSFCNGNLTLVKEVTR